MAGEIFKLFGSIGLKTDEAEKGMDTIVDKAEKTGSSLESKFSAIGSNIHKFIVLPAIAAATAIGAIALKKGWDRLIGIDTARAKLQALGHDAGQVDAIMENALASVKGTAFGLESAATAAASAVAAGIEPGKELERYLSLVGDTAAIAGTNFEDMGSIFNKVMTSGVIQAQELNQLSDKGIPIFQMLADEMGVTADEVKKLASDGKISSETFLNAIENGFGGAAKTMGELSLTAAIDNMWASVGRLGAAFLGAGDDAEGFFDKLKPLLGDLTDWFDSLAPIAQNLGVHFGNLFGRLITGVKEFASIVTSVYDIIWGSQSRKDNTDLMEQMGISPEVANTIASISESMRSLITAIESIYDIVWGSQSVKDNTDLMEQLGLGEDAIGFVTKAAEGINKIRTSFDRLSTLLRTKVSNQLSKVQSWFNDLVEILGEIDFELLIENLLEFGANAIDVFTDITESILEFLKPLTQGWDNAIDIILNLFKGLVRAFNQAMRGDWSGAFSTLKTAIGEALINMGDNILEAWSGIWDNVKEVAAGIDWQDVAQSIMSTLGNAINAAIAFLGDIGATIKSWISEKLGLGADGSWSDIGNKVLENIKSGIETAKSTVSGLGKIITDWLIEKLGLPEEASWATIGTNLLQNIIDAASNAGEVLGEFVTNLITGINDLMTAEQFNDFVRNFLSFIASAVTGAGVALLAIAVAFLDGFIAGVIGQDSKFSKIATDILGAIEKYINSENMNVDWYRVLGIPDWLRAWMSNETIPYMFNNDMYEGATYQETHQGNPEDDRGSGGRSNEGTTSTRSSWLSPKTVSAASDTGRAFQTQTPTIDTSVVDKLIAEVTAKINAAVASIEELGRNYTAKLIDGMTKGITTNQSKVILNLGILGDNMKTELDKIHEKAVQAIDIGMNKVQVEYRSGLLKAYATVRDNLARITEAFRSQIGAVTKAGEDTGRGFYNGLASQRGRIISLANDIARSVLTTMTRALDINSPSGETEWIADMTIDGLVNNLKNGIQRVKDATSQVANAMLFDPQDIDFGYTNNQATSAAPSLMEIMLDEVTRLLKQLLDKDDALYMDGYELARRGTKYINQENELRVARNTRLKGGSGFA